MLNAPDASPFALTEHVFATNVAGHSLLFWTANGLVLLGVGAGIVWGTRKMISAAFGQRHSSHSLLSTQKSAPAEDLYQLAA